MCSLKTGCSLSLHITPSPDHCRNQIHNKCPLIQMTEYWSFSFTIKNGISDIDLALTPTIQYPREGPHSHHMCFPSALPESHPTPYRTSHMVYKKRSNYNSGCLPIAYEININLLLQTAHHSQTQDYSRLVSGSVVTVDSTFLTLAAFISLHPLSCLWWTPPSFQSWF